MIINCPKFNLARTEFKFIKNECERDLLTSSAGLQISSFHFVGSQRTIKKCTKMKNAPAGLARRAEMVGFAHYICKFVTFLNFVISLRYYVRCDWLI